MKAAAMVFVLLVSGLCFADPSGVTESGVNSYTRSDAPLVAVNEPTGSNCALPS